MSTGSDISIPGHDGRASGVLGAVVNWIADLGEELLP